MTKPLCSGCQIGCCPSCGCGLGPTAPGTVRAVDSSVCDRPFTVAVRLMVSPAMPHRGKLRCLAQVHAPRACVGGTREEVREAGEQMACAHSHVTGRVLGFNTP